MPLLWIILHKQVRVAALHPAGSGGNDDDGGDELNHQGINQKEWRSSLVAG